MDALGLFGNSSTNPSAQVSMLKSAAMPNDDNSRPGGTLMMSVNVATSAQSATRSTAFTADTRRARPTSARPHSGDSSCDSRSRSSAAASVATTIPRPPSDRNSFHVAELLEHSTTTSGRVARCGCRILGEVSNTPTPCKDRLHASNTPPHDFSMNRGDSSMIESRLKSVFRK